MSSFNQRRFTFLVEVEQHRMRWICIECESFQISSRFVRKRLYKRNGRLRKVRWNFVLKCSICWHFQHPQTKLSLSTRWKGWYLSHVITVFLAFRSRFSPTLAIYQFEASAHKLFSFDRELSLMNSRSLLFSPSPSVYSSFVVFDWSLLAGA